VGAGLREEWIIEGMEEWIGEGMGMTFGLYDKVDKT
jgi:hypothetical protein